MADAEQNTTIIFAESKLGCLATSTTASWSGPSNRPIFWTSRISFLKNDFAESMC